MSAAAQIAKLEALLERIQSKRTDAPTPFTGELAAAPDVEATIEAPIDLDEPMAPTPEPAVPASAVIAAPRQRSPEPTPMERAVSTELDLGPADDDDDEPELEISYPEPDEPALLLEVDDASESMPTAPIHTRAPDTVRPEPSPPEPEPDVLLDSLPEPEPQIEIPPQPERIELAVAAPSAPIAKVVARPKPKTFGELLDRALALRPR